MLGSSRSICSPSLVAASWEVDKEDVPGLVNEAPRDTKLMNVAVRSLLKLER